MGSLGMGTGSLGDQPDSLQWGALPGLISLWVLCDYYPFELGFPSDG